MTTQNIKNFAKCLSYGITVVLTATLTSCSDYLEVEPANKQSTGNFYKTEAQIDQALTGLYGTLKPISTYLMAMSEMRSDNIWILTDNKQNDYADIATFNGDGLLTDNIVKNCWSDYFKIVVAANVFLEKTEKLEFSKDEVKVQYQAEARFLRALAYFDLVRFFGRVPAPTRVLSTEEAFLLKQSEPKDIYEQIIVPDMEYAVAKLADTAFDYLGQSHQERITKTAAKGFLGKVYLTMAGFPLQQTDKKALAQQLFKEVIDHATTENKYWASTIDEWNKMWLHENDNKYFIFEIQYICDADQGNPMVPISVPSNPGAEWCNNSISLITGTHLYVERGLQRHYIEAPANTSNYYDKRTWGTINTVETTDGDGNVTTSEGNTFLVKFFENKKKRATLGVSDMDAEILNRTYWPQNYPLLRLEDVMLLYAECVGTTPEGYQMVNKIRQRAGLSALSALSEDDFQKAVANERRYELCEEGQRWFDLVRQNKYVETLQKMFNDDDDTAVGTYKNYANRVTADSYLYPIPLSQMEVREGLYEQNKGY